MIFCKFQWKLCNFQKIGDFKKKKLSESFHDFGTYLQVDPSFYFSMLQTPEMNRSGTESAKSGVWLILSKLA